MPFIINATYRNGAIYPDTPLDLAGGTPVHGMIAPTKASATNGNDPPALGPQSPPFTAALLDTLLDSCSFTAPPLPADFSRSDIYSDHD